jgi:hypothetical protein
LASALLVELDRSSSSQEEALMFSSTNFWMGFAGLLYLVAGVFLLRKEISAARGWNKLIALGCAFFAASLAAFAPEHFYGGPDYIQSMAPTWMPVRSFWPYFVGCALLTGATSLTLRKFVRLSSTLLGLMFFLFVCMIYLPSLLAHLKNRLAWIFALRDLSFCAGAWALAGLLSRGSSPRLSKWMILFGRVVLAIAAIFFAVQHSSSRVCTWRPIAQGNARLDPPGSVLELSHRCDFAHCGSSIANQQESPRSRGIDWPAYGDTDVAALRPDTGHGFAAAPGT